MAAEAGRGCVQRRASQMEVRGVRDGGGIDVEDLGGEMDPFRRG